MWHILNLGSKMTFDKKKKKYIIEKIKVEILVLNLNVFFFLKVPLQGDDLGL